ncbi:hypothetical protein EXIGLDRAFT_269237 [Exidia glandulosa HHB12029]|uniref:F-box domain-containing protein n=1 Tax=Exidia glandulosa HHB12029 TaxID=1314781 RepID=A0A165DNM8_EXIGL|nr:hypothetical protein EXIGLDRAFT_269237 [Exidia glandulosa HHB12029]
MTVIRKLDIRIQYVRQIPHLAFIHVASMSTLSALPVELVLLVSEHAAWSEIVDHKRWVGSLRLVCRRFDRTVKTIYFYTLILHRLSPLAFENLALLQDSPLSLTRRLVVTNTIIYDDNRLSDGSFSASSANLRDFTGSLTQFQKLRRIHPSLDLASVFITTAIDVSPMHWLTSIPRAHIICEHWRSDLFTFGESDHSLGDAQIRWLVIDAFSPNGTPTTVDAIPQFLSGFVGLLTIPSLKRLLLRPRFEKEESHIFFCDAARPWAITAPDGRIWLDDTVVRLEEWDDAGYDALDIADALAGHDLWLSGAQLYTLGSHASPEK